MTTAQRPPTDHPLGDWQGLSPLSVWADTAVGALFIVPAAIVGTVVLIVLDLPWWALAPLPGALALIGGLTALDMTVLKAVSYRVTDERMEMRSGVLAKTYRSVPRERVRSVDVAAPVYARPFGLCIVTVGTGEQVGSESDQVKLQFVTAAQGERLRRELLYRDPPTAVGAEGADGAEGAADADGLELARLDRRWFAYAPATTATLGIGIGAVAALIGANAQSEGWIHRWISERTGLPGSAEIGAFVMARLLFVVPAALFGLLLSGTVVLVAVAVETWWDYRLTRESNGTVVMRRGLLNSQSLTIEGRRLNGVTLHEPLVLRAVGGADVRAVATGLGAADAEKTQAKSRLCPPMPRARARELAADLMRTPESPLDLPLTAHPRAALRRRLVRAGWASLAGFAVAAGLAWLHTLAAAAWWDAAHEIEERLNPLPVATHLVEAAPPWGWWLLGAAFAAVAFWYAVGSHRALGHGLHPRYLVVRQGMAVRDTVTLERSAVIGWRITRTPFQRRAGLAHVSATTASGKGMYTAADVGLGQGLAWAGLAVPDLLSQFLERDGGERPEDPRARG
ncbi:PH domain-containing protein [Nocardiopsis sp. CC223A]|uniref:PH domain-containing protein n=1 Tax=Nocardiopsis sp. CC223A TaxID=3044051 RepID=UPI00278BE057|nr:PH domain-containing protein [Nocardiopsis sp. CC223A]